MEDLAYIKMRAGIKDADNDDVIICMIADATTEVCLYCHQRILPEALNYLVQQMVIDTINADNADIASIKRGDTQITYVTTISRDNFSERQKQAMRSFRTLRIM